MKQALLKLAVVLLVVGGAITVFWPINFWRQFDANMYPLALTESEAWCNGRWGAASNWQENAAQVIQCMETEDLSTEPSVPSTIIWWCKGIVASGAYQLTLYSCVDVVDGEQLWPKLNGGMAWEWNAAHPRPSVPVEQLEEPLRRNNERDSGSRGDSALP